MTGLVIAPLALGVPVGFAAVVAGAARFGLDLAGVAAIAAVAAGRSANGGGITADATG